MDRWIALELARMLWTGIRWEVVIKVNPAMIASKPYSFYHENKYKDAEGIRAALLESAVVDW